MQLMKRIILLFVFAVCGLGRVQAQQTEIAFGLRGGNNALFGDFATLSFEADYSAKQLFAIRGGVQHNTFARSAAEVRPKLFCDLKFGKLAAELLLSYTYQSSINNYAVGGGVVLNNRHIWATLGYYYRIMTRATSTIHEPFNIYYELGIRCLPNRERWDMNIILSNSRLCELERHYQPSLTVEGWWFPLQCLGVQLGTTYKAAGAFNISSDYYQLYANLGVCYRW